MIKFLVCLFKGHNWEKLIITQTEPAGEVKMEFQYFNQSRLEEIQGIVRGTTTVLFQCSNCKNTKIEKMLGKKI